MSRGSTHSLNYATTFVLCHADQAAAEIPQHEFLIQFDLDINNWLGKANFLQKHDINLYEEPLDLVYVCAEKDLASSITTLANHGRSLTDDSMQRYGTPLFAAFANKSANAARVILEQPGAVNADEIVKEVIMDDHQGRSGYDRLVKERWQWAVEPGYDDLALYHIYNIDPAGGFPNQTVLHQALNLTAQKGRIKIPTALLENTADINASRGKYGNVLQIASWFSHIKVVKLLLEHGADVNASSSNGTALYIALRSHHTEIVKLLIEYSTDINATSNEGIALYMASWFNYSEIVKLLLERGADINATSDNKTALCIA